MRYFIYLSFDGKRYHGWQIQPGADSVQETLEKALSLFLRKNIQVTGAGRTDTGVHARMMVAHFDYGESLDTSWVCDKLNSILPDDIAVQRVLRVNERAHARFDATSRTYRYYVSSGKDPFLRDYSWCMVNMPDFDLMNKAASMLIGNTDFTSFSKLHTDTRTNDCHLTAAEWTELKPGLWVFTITADRFLRNMVRAIVGTLMEVGRHKITLQDFDGIMQRHDRCAAGDSAPAQGLFLENVTYPDSIFEV